MAPKIAQAEAPPAIEATAQPNRLLFERITDVLRGSNIATACITMVASLSVHSMISPATAEAGCVTTTTAESTTTVCGPDVGNPDPAPSNPDAPSHNQPDKPPKHQQPNQPSAPAAGPDRLFSYDQCGGWGNRICTTGCGDVASADFASDLTGRRITPLDVLPILSPQYYIPGSGTRPEGFKAVARHYGLHEKPGTLASAKKAIGEMGGVAVAEFNNGVAVSRSGHSSSVAVVDHYVVLDRLKNGRFAMADPHQGSDRHNERSRNGKTRYWTGHEMKKEGLINVWTVTP